MQELHIIILTVKYECDQFMQDLLHIIILDCKI